MNSEDVAEYLKTHPEFFEQYAEMISEINIPHPHGGRTIPISERQILTLREKAKQLEGKLREVMQYGEENDVVTHKMHALTLALLGARDAGAVIVTALKHLREDFAVPHVALKIWRGGDATLAAYQNASEATRAYAATLTGPNCSGAAAADTALLFEGAPAQGSFAYVPLRDGDTFGLLALASDDPKRYYAGMGTLYLQRLGELVACALAVHLPK
jgi:uncharacterized protein YigA (DUF484 family)